MRSVNNGLYESKRTCHMIKRTYDTINNTVEENLVLTKVPRTNTADFSVVPEDVRGNIAGFLDHHTLVLFNVTHRAALR